MVGFRAPRGRLEWFLVFVLGFTTGCSTSPSQALLVTAGGSDYVLVLDATSGKTIDSVSVDPRRGERDEPHGIAISPDNDFWYVTVSHGDATLWKFTWPESRRVGRVRLGISGASRVGISPDGQRGFVPDYYRDDPSVVGRIAVVRLRDLAVIGRPSVCGAPHDAQVSPDGTVLAIACSASDEVVFMETASLQVTRRVPVGSDSVNARPLNLIWVTGHTVAVTLHGHGEVVIVGDAPGAIERIPVGGGPAQLALVPGGEFLVTANRGDGTASIVSLSQHRETARIPLSVSHPHGVSLSENGEVAFVSYEGTTDTYGGVLAVDLATQTILWNVPAGAFTLGVIRVTHN